MAKRNLAIESFTFAVFCIFSCKVRAIPPRSSVVVTILKSFSVGISAPWSRSGSIPLPTHQSRSGSGSSSY